MASINASTSGAGGVITTADNTGTLQLQSGGTTIATISSTGLQQNVGAPTFSAYNSSATSLPNGSLTKIQFQTENWDTNNNYDTSNGRFTPTVAGYYQINAGIGFASFQSTETYLIIYKNGSAYSYPIDIIITRLYNFSGTNLVYCNGTTDYIEIYVYQSSGGAVNTVTGNANTYFNASMVRSA